MKNTIRVLHLEDSPWDADLIRDKLDSENIPCDITVVQDRMAFESALSMEPFELILCDFNLPGYDGFAATLFAKAKQPDTPVIVISGTMGEEEAVECLRVGATDYLLKQRLDRLASAVLRAIEEAAEHRARQAIERQLHESEERFRQFAQHSSDAFRFVAMNPERVLYVSPAFEKIWGLPAERLYQDPRAWMSVIHPGDRTGVQKLFEAALAGHSPHFEAEYRVLRPDGSYRWVLDSGTPIRDADGRVVRMGGMAKDITERKKAENLLAESEHFIRTTMDALSAHVAVIDADGRILVTNQAWRIFAEQNGACCERVGEGANYLDTCDRSGAAGAKYANDAAQAIRDIIAGRKSDASLEYPCHTPGKERWFRCHFTRFHGGDPARVVVAHENITATKKAEDEILQAKRLFETLAEASPAGIFQTNAKGQTTYVNQRLQEINGRPAEEMLGMGWARTIHPEDAERVMAKREKLLAEGQIDGDHFRIVRPDGGIRWCLLQVSNLRDAAGKSDGQIGTVLDITDRKLAELQTQRSQRLESIGTLAGGIAHDLNNTLAPILAAVGLLREESPDHSGEFLDMIEIHVRRGADMVKQLLTFARGVEGVKVPVQPRHLLNDIKKMIENTFPKSIQVRAAMDKDTPPVLCDPTQLHQVLLNLCVNARDAMPDGGLLTLEAKAVQCDAGFIGVGAEAKPGPHVMFQVADTGTGIPQKIMDRIFDPFFTTKAPDKGTGLGLSTVLGIVKNHGGFVHVQSEPGRGSCFEVYLPVATIEAAPKASSREDTDIQVKGKTALVVDDEPAIRMMLNLMMTKLGYKVMLASDGAEALLQFAGRHHDIDLIVTDLNMPQMDGATMIRAINRMAPQIKIIVMTGMDDEKNEEDLRALGAHQMLHKPFDQKELKRTLNKVFSRKGDVPPPPAAPAKAAPPDARHTEISHRTDLSGHWRGDDVFKKMH